uniref:Uncharacterized protein n=1 Tax=Davidia involucrata TaxID=16924 RepID=A0A5B6YR04_DAVIN
MASRQLINFQKSSFFFSKNTHLHFRRLLSRQYRISNVIGHDRYLGFPTIIGCSKTDLFTAIQENVRAKTDGWKEKLLFPVGKEIVIKAVATAMPSYAMSVFKLPLKLCRDIQYYLCYFWWGQQGSESKIPWLK